MGKKREGRKGRSLTLTWNKVSRFLAPSNLSNPSHQEELGLVLGIIFSIIGAKKHNFLSGHCHAIISKF